MKLSELKPQECGIVKRIMMSENQQQRLLYLGIYPGVCIRLEKVAPLKDPSAYFVSGNLIILRNVDAEKIEIVKKGGGV